MPCPENKEAWSYKMYLGDLRLFLKRSTYNYQSGDVYTPFGIVSSDPIRAIYISDEWKNRVWKITTEIYWSLIEEWKDVLRHSSLLRLHDQACLEEVDEGSSCRHKFSYVSPGEFAACLVDEDVALAFRKAHFAWNGEEPVYDM